MLDLQKVQSKLFRTVVAYICIGQISFPLTTQHCLHTEYEL